jgi:DNA-binding transcriptional ArsR family regulator
MSLRDQIADRVKDGWTNREIARELGIARQTVDNHISELYGEAGISGNRRGGRVLKSGDLAGPRRSLIHWLLGDFDDDTLG